MPNYKDFVEGDYILGHNTPLLKEFIFSDFLGNENYCRNRTEEDRTFNHGNKPTEIAECQEQKRRKEGILFNM